jgi:hypothetical protein
VYAVFLVHKRKCFENGLTTIHEQELKADYPGVKDSHDPLRPHTITVSGTDDAEPPHTERLILSGSCLMSEPPIDPYDVSAAICSEKRVRNEVHANQIRCNDIIEHVMQGLNTVFERTPAIGLKLLGDAEDSFDGPATTDEPHNHPDNTGDSHGEDGDECKYVLKCHLWLILVGY